MLINLNLTEKQRESKEYLTEMADNCIATLVCENEGFDKAFNYYNCKRNPSQFKYLEDKFGIDVITELKMMPLIRRHVDILVGDLLRNKFTPLVTCRDGETLEKIEEQKKEAVNKAETNALHKSFVSKLKGGNPVDVEREVLSAKESFVSEYEKAVNFIMQFVLNSRDIDVKSKRAELLKSLLITGACAYQAKVRNGEKTPSLEVFDMRNVFYERIVSSPYIKNSPRAVIRRRMTVIDIINEYGEFMTQEEINSLPDITPETFMTLDKSGHIIYNEDYDSNTNLIDVYCVEWIANNKTKNGYRADRYKCTRIGADIYVDYGKDDTVVRSKTEPNKCSLSINGVVYSPEKGKPYSLVLAMAETQDTYDLLNYFLEYTIQSSGSKGAYVNMDTIPKWLGNDEMERAMKWFAMRKQGMSFIENDPEKDESKLNTIFNGFDDSVSHTSVQAIQLAINHIESQACKISGVAPERLFDIEQRDAVKNVQVGIQQSAVITKPIMHLIDCISIDLMTDLINLFKESYKDGYIGYQTLNSSKLDVIKLDSKFYAFTDHGIQIVDNDESRLELEGIKEIITPLIQAGQTDITLLVDMVTSSSVTDLKQKIKNNYSTQKQAKEQIEQISQQAQQLQEQLKQAQDAMAKLENENKALKDKALDIREYEVKEKIKLSSKELDLKEKKNNEDIEINKKKLQIETLQMVDNNPYNNELNL